MTAGLLIGLASGGTLAAQDSSAHSLPPMITVTRDAPHPTLDVPAAVTTVRPDSERPGEPNTSADQTLFDVPGLTVANRTNPSQDVRLSIRGFGARSQFGVRSIRVFRDGMPLTGPDGQTAIDYMDLESVGQVQVLRGTASALYGNASGGVIDLESEPAPPDLAASQVRLWGGSDALVHLTALVGGTSGPFTYETNVGHISANNYRAFSLQRLTNGYSHVGLRAVGTDFTLGVLGLDTPTAENPGAITRAQFDSNPREADPLSVKKEARKEVKDLQVGLGAHRLSTDGTEWSASAYTGSRSLYNPLTYAVVGVKWHMGGGAVRVTKPIVDGATLWRLTAGADVQYQNDDRQNWANCDGLTATSVTCPSTAVEEGTLSLDQREIVSSAGPYARAEMERGRWDASAGVRADEVDFRVDDQFLADGDDSGHRLLHAVSPMAGVAYRVASFVAVYGNVSTGFETPTTTELANKPDGTGGFNPTLQPQLSTTVELGAKEMGPGPIGYDVAVFHTDVRNELIPFTALGSDRTYYQNAGGAHHDGIELSLRDAVGPVILDGSYSYSRFRFQDFVVAGANYDGDAIPGIPVHQVQASATWRARDGFLVVEGEGKSAVWVNDGNQAQAPGFALFNVRAGGTHALGRGDLMPIVGVQNMFNSKYVGSVAINATGTTLAATKFYEPGSGRTFLIGLEAGALKNW